MVFAAKGKTHVSGILDVHPKGFGFLRQKYRLNSDSNEDTYVPHEVIRRNYLKMGMYVEGIGEPGRAGNIILQSLLLINGKDPRAYIDQRPFHKLTTVSPYERIRLETKSGNLSTRILDVLSPLGKGSRCLIVSPPKAGKTTLLKDIANAVTENHPEIQIYALLIDERPEEVTDIQRSIKGEVIASCMDQTLYNHCRISRFAIEIAKQRVLAGEDVLIIMDSITRMSRAFNTAEGESGRTLSGGLDSRAMEFPRSFFGAARKIENGGSLTIIGTALIETGSRMDDLIFREFQGTGNQEIQLSRKLSDKRIFPALDLEKTRTRREELLFSRDELEASARMRRALSGLNPDVAMERLIDTISKYKQNCDFVTMLANARL